MVQGIVNMTVPTETAGPATKKTDKTKDGASQEFGKLMEEQAKDAQPDTVPYPPLFFQWVSADPGQLVDQTGVTVPADGAQAAILEANAVQDSQRLSTVPGAGATADVQQTDALTNAAALHNEAQESGTQQGSAVVGKEGVISIAEAGKKTSVTTVAKPETPEAEDAGMITKAHEGKTASEKVSRTANAGQAVQTSLRGDLAKDSESAAKDVKNAETQLAQTEAMAPERSDVKNLTFTVKEPEQIHTPKSMEELDNMITKQIMSGKQEFEIQLEPHNLGKLLIKVTYEAGKAAVSIVCTDAKTMQAMSQNAKELGSILETHMGTQTEIVVEKSSLPDYLEQERQGKEKREQEAGHHREKKESDKGETETLDFVQQLRLGLV